MQLTRGYIACSIRTTGPDNYQDQQLQQWGWTNSPPIQITASNQVFSITWSVTGSGSKFVSLTTTAPNGVVHVTTTSSAWTETGSVGGPTVQLQVRASNNQVILGNFSSISLPFGLKGTEQTIVDGMPLAPRAITNAVSALPLPAGVPWNGPLAIDRLLEGSVDPAPVVASPSRREIGSRLGQLASFATAKSYAGSQVLPNPQLSGVQAPAGSTSTATWSWRIYY